MTTNWVAIYAAIVATLALGWRIYEWFRKRPNIKVKVMFAYMYGVPGVNNRKQHISVTAMNRGHYSTTIEMAYIIISRKDRPYLQHMDSINSGYLPRRLNQGESLSVTYDPDVIKGELQKKSGDVFKVKGAGFRDQAGRHYNGGIRKAIEKTLY